MNDKMSGSLRLPLQVAPIDRTSSAAALNGSGVDVSQLAQIAGAIIPEILNKLPDWLGGW
jgi:hypothetical protein